MLLEIIHYERPTLNVVLDRQLSGITLDLNLEPVPDLNIFIDELRVRQATRQQVQTFTPNESVIPQINNNNPSFQYVTLVGAKGDIGQRGEQAGVYSEPSFTRNDDGKIVRIDYSGGQFKVLDYYLSGRLSTITTTHHPTDISVKRFNYIDGLLVRITQE